MLAGEYGEGVAKSLELLVALGDVFGAGFVRSNDGDLGDGRDKLSVRFSRPIFHFHAIECILHPCEFKNRGA